MLIEDILFQKFNEQTSGNNYFDGQRLINNDLVSGIELSERESIIFINGDVISENLFNEYNTRIQLDTEEMHILSTYCSCSDYEHKSPKKINYCCKHLVASFSKAVERLCSHPLLNSLGSEDNKIAVGKGDILEILLGDIRRKEKVKIEIYINKDKWDESISAEFKIGLHSVSSSNLYVIKDINQFISSYDNNFPVEYSKNFAFWRGRHELSISDKRIIDFINVLKSLDNRSHLNKAGENYIDGKFINIPDYLTREFFTIIMDHKVYLNDGFFSRPVETEILFSTPPIEFDLKHIKGMYVLKCPDGMPVSLNKSSNVLLFGTSLYLPDHEFCYKIAPYLNVFSQANVITIADMEEETILKRLIPDLRSLADEITLSKSILDKIVISDVEFKFYFDREDSEVRLVLKVKYGPYELNVFNEFSEKVIYRNYNAEQKVISTIRNLGFEVSRGEFCLSRGDDYLFKFFKGDILRLHQFGEVFYSENFKGIKHIGSKGIVGDVKPGSYNYFEMDFKIGDIPKNETTNILRAFRDKLKYYRLKNGEFLDLEELELKQFLKLLDIISSKNIIDNHIEIHKSRGAFLHSYIENSKLRHLKGKEALDDLWGKLRKLEGLEFKAPEEFQQILRPYQKVGYNWFKTMEYLGFGGILGDEMGLGKTVQTISFLKGSKGKRTLIVAPTSLIYNWVNEFKWFAPDIIIIPVVGSVEERERLLSNLEEYDVLITTYNLLKRDNKSYKNISFDYCILDEAQYIKNSHSQNAISVKGINASIRFALTGTPVENSSMELWSIFDFIMPGYLYDERRFSVRYSKRLHEAPEVLEELNMLINPFILRRTKKEVLKELPDKIEKKLVVSMNEEQTKVYQTYARYAVDLIEKKVLDDEFQNSKIEILAYLTKLRQICLDPSVVMENYNGGSGKMDALVEVLHRAVDEGHKILVFSQFTTVLKNIEKRIIAEGISFSYLDGTIAAEKRIVLVDAFNNSDTSVFLISLKAGGTGLNLTSADIVIHFDPWWNPAVENQAEDRAHRIGQKRVVEVIKIISKGTIEEKILLLQEEKKKLISELLNSDLSNSDGFLDLTPQQLLKLFEVAE